MKKTLVFILIIVFLLSGTLVANGFPENVHNEHLTTLLFGFKMLRNRDAITMIEYASYLSLDQFNHHGSNKLDYLLTKGINGIPKNIDEINFTQNSGHRTHTHRGWDYTLYTGYQRNEDVAHWKIRKTILLKTIEKVFGFKKSSIPILGIELGHEAQNESFAALVYYIHVIGDHIADYQNSQMLGSRYNMPGLMMPIARKNADNNNPDILWELQKHAQVLFKSNANVKKLAQLNDQISSLRKSADTSYIDSAGLGSNKYAGRLLEILKNNLPSLLKNEDFFRNKFFVNTY